MVAMLRKLRKHLTENADYVGPNSPKRRGASTTTSGEARHLRRGDLRRGARAGEEGIEFHPLPILPEDHN